MVGTIQYKQEEMLEKLQQLYENWGSTRYDVIRAAPDMPDPSTYRDRFGSLDNARNLAGVKIYKYKEGADKEELLDTFRYIEQNENVVTSKNIMKYKLNPYTNHGSIYDLREEAGLYFTNNVDIPTEDKMKFLIDDIKRLDDEHRFVSTDILNTYGAHSEHMYRKYFLNLEEARKIANCDKIKGRPKSFWEEITECKTFEQFCLNKNIEPNDPYHVYALDANTEPQNQVIYVGQTSDIKNRISTHHHGHHKPGRVQLKGVNDILVLESKETEPTARERERELFYEMAIEYPDMEILGGR